MNINKDKIFFRHLVYFNSINITNWISTQASRISKGSRVLDAGAGKCLYRSLFNHCEYKTQDFCQVPDIGKYGEMDYVCDITSIPVDERSFDVILCTEVLEHVPKPIKVIQEFSRILRQGGKLLITAPLGCGIHQPPHIYYGGYSPYWYSYFLPKFGFKDIIVTPNEGFFKHYAQDSVRFLSFLFPKNMNKFKRILLFPFELVFTFYFRLLLPMVCHLLDRLDKDKSFTVGYFVEAKKA